MFPGEPARAPLRPRDDAATYAALPGPSLTPEPPPPMWPPAPPPTPVLHDRPTRLLGLGCAHFRLFRQPRCKFRAFADSLIAQLRKMFGMCNAATSDDTGLAE